MEPYDLSCLEVVSLVGEPFSPNVWQWTDEKLGKGKSLHQQHLGPNGISRMPAGQRSLADAHEARFLRRPVSRRAGRHCGRPAAIRCPNTSWAISCSASPFP